MSSVLSTNKKHDVVGGQLPNLFQEKAEKCLQSLDILVTQGSDLFQYDVVTKEHIDQKTKEQRGRFKLWTSHMDVFAPSMYSLEYRLRNDLEVLEIVRHMVNVIEIRTNKAIALVCDLESQGVNPSQADVQLFVNELDKTSTTISRLQKVCIAFQEAIRTPSLSVFLDEIPVQSSQSSHQKPCQGHGSSKSLFEDSMKNILSTRYPRISLGLLNALLKATCARKRFFQYLASQRLRTTEADARPNNLSKQELVGSRSRQQDSSGSYSRGSRGPSFHEDISNFKLNKSPVLSASLAGLEYSGAERFPEPPVVKEDSEELECPYCFWRMPREVFSTPELWRKHVEDDLQPYQCLHPECLHLTKLFTSRIDWIKHQQDDHPTMLICPICPDVEPSPLTRDHYASSHNITLSSSQFRTLSKRAEKSKVCSTLEACPFCEYCEAEPKSQYLVHGIADHLLEISILCISAETQTEGNESLGFPMANVTSEGIKKNLSTKPQIEGRDSRPPLSMQNIARIVNLFEGINEPYYESHTDNHIFGGSPDMIRLSTKKGAGDTASRNRGTETTNPSSVDVVLSETLPHNQPYYSSTGQRPPAPATKDNVHWIWNEKEQDHYYTSIDPQGEICYHWRNMVPIVSDIEMD